MGHCYTSLMVVGEFAVDVDVVIIGGGPAGYSCAFAAAERGRSVTIVDPRTTIGGMCLHEGCIPTKTLLHAIATWSSATEQGMAHDRTGPDAESLRAWTIKCQEKLGRGLESTARKHDIAIIRGTARFLDGREVQVAGKTIQRLRFKRAVICTGSIRRPHHALKNTAGVISAAHLASCPKDIRGTVTVLGNSAIAAEAAAIAAGLGANTTLVLCGDRLLPRVPGELVEPLLNAARFEIETGDITAPPETNIIVDATARTGAIAELGLENTSIETTDHWIVANDRMQTSESRILAAGDCIGPPLWAGAAMHRGRIAAETIAGGHAAWDPTAVAQLSYTDPEICWTGTQEGEHIQSLIVPWTSSGLATLMDRAEGRTMICWDTQTGVLTGIGATGEGACGLADGFTTTLEMGTTLQDLADMVPAHPTRSELLGDAARQALAAS